MRYLGTKNLHKKELLAQKWPGYSALCPVIEHFYKKDCDRTSLVRYFRNKEAVLPPPTCWISLSSFNCTPEIFSRIASQASQITFLAAFS